MTGYIRPENRGGEAPASPGGHGDQRVPARAFPREGRAQGNTVVLLGSASGRSGGQSVVRRRVCGVAIGSQSHPEPLTANGSVDDGASEIPCVAVHVVLGAGEHLELDIRTDSPAAHGAHEVVGDDRGRGGARGKDPDTGPASRRVLAHAPFGPVLRGLGLLGFQRGRTWWLGSVQGLRCRSGGFSVRRRARARWSPARSGGGA